MKRYDWTLLFCLPALVGGVWGLLALRVPNLDWLLYGSKFAFVSYEFTAVLGFIFALLAIWFAISRTRDPSINAWLKMRAWGTWLLAVGATVLNVIVLTTPVDY